MRVMNTVCRETVRLLGLMLMVGVSSLAAADAKEQGSHYTDEKYEFSVTVPEPWKPARLQTFSVPGVIRNAWSGKNSASIVAFVQEPDMAYSPRFLVDASAKAIKENLKGKIVAQEVRTVAGKKAMWLIMEGPGTGAAITGEGDVTTTQHWVAIPRKTDIVILLLTSPTADAASHKSSFEKAVASLTVKGEQTEEQKNAE